MEQVGFHTVSVVENDADCVRTIALNRPHLQHCAISRDVQSIQASTLLEEAGRTMGACRALQPGEVDLVTGGPPCQPFSTAGKRQSIEDIRGNLFIDFVRLVRDIQPRFYVMENVKGLLSAPLRHRPHSQRGSIHPPLELNEQPGTALKLVISKLETLGYRFVHGVLQAADYGVPQNRQRVIFIGSRDGAPVTLPPTTHSQIPIANKPKWLTLYDAIGVHKDLNPEFLPYPESRLKYLRLLTAGQHWRHLPPELQAEAMGGAYDSTGGRTTFYRRLSWDKPSPTITTSPNQKSTEMCHPEELRPLSVLECSRIQTFPDNWKFYGSTASKYRQIGNAVPALLSLEIGIHLRRLMCQT
jgi:DNA (cytosine-5)-methyltransferase 1